MTMLDGQRALVTGAARGLGLAMSERFAAEGARVLIQDLDLAEAEKSAAALRAKGRDALAMGGSVTSESDMQACFARLDREWGGLDILVNNAGVSANKSALDLPLVDWSRVMDVNLNAPFMWAKEAGKRFVAQKSGNLVNICSIWGIDAAPDRIAYCVSKAALIQMTKCLANEWAGSNVRVNGIAPGYTETKMLRDVIDAGRVDVQSLHRRTPMGRLGTPEEIADMALYIVSPGASFLTGQVIAVDGGWTAYGFY